jgi:hypothetical protein
VSEPVDLRVMDLPTQVILPLRPAHPAPKLLYASCPECMTLFVDLTGEGIFCTCKPERTFCPTRYGLVHLIDRARRKAVAGG